MVGSQVVIDESFIPDEARLSAQGLSALRPALFDVDVCEGRFFEQSHGLDVGELEHSIS